MLSKLKKSLVIFLSAVILVTSIASPVALAQTPQGIGQGNWWFPNYDDFLDKVNLAPANEIFGERYTHAQVSWIILSVLNILVGPIASCADKRGAFSDCLKESLSSGGDAGLILPLAMANDALLHTKPVSSVDYIASKMERFGIVNETYAQTSGPSTVEAGFGFTNSLIIIQKLWVVSRDAAYSLVILMILVLGFMIMFRAQLGARTAITIQSALPRVIIGLLLITFSYAIAGFLVDMVFVSQGIVSGVIANSTLIEKEKIELGVLGVELVSPPIDDKPSAVQVFEQMNGVSGSILALFVSFIFAMFSIVFTSATSSLASAGAAIAILTVFSQVIIMFSILLIILIMVVTIVTLIRIWWMMMRTYVVILLLVAAAPFIFLFGIVKDNLNGMWFKTMIANLSIFFSVGFFLLLCNIILYSTMQKDIAVELITGLIEFLGYDVNPYNVVKETVRNGEAVMPGFASFGNTSVIGLFISISLFISIPKFASTIRDSIQNSNGFSFDNSQKVLGGAIGIGAMDRVASKPLADYAGDVEGGSGELNPYNAAYQSGKLGRYSAAKAASGLLNQAKKLGK